MGCFYDVVKKKFKTRRDAANFFGISLRTLHTWMYLERFPRLSEQQRIHNNFDFIDLNEWRKEYLQKKEMKA